MVPTSASTKGCISAAEETMMTSGQSAREPARAHLRRRPQLFALTIFCGSFLLFLVQPIIAKELLPQFGGSASVWLTCLVFFQSALLLGYAGADRFACTVPARLQIALVVVVVLAAAATLPIVPALRGGSAHGVPAYANPTLSVLATLAVERGAALRAGIRHHPGGAKLVCPQPARAQPL